MFKQYYYVLIEGGQICYGNISAKSKKKAVERLQKYHNKMILVSSKPVKKWRDFVVRD